MAGEDQEKTEEPTSKKIEDARKDGNVPKSQDLAGFVTLAVAIFVVIGLLGYVKDQVFGFYNYVHEFIGQELDRKLLFKISITMLLNLALIILPIAICVAIAGIIANTMQFGLIFTTKPLEPNLNKINPIKGLKNLFSMKKLIESVKMTLKVTIVFTVGFLIYDRSTIVAKRKNDNPGFGYAAGYVRCRTYRRFNSKISVFSRFTNEQARDKGRI